MFAFLLFVSTSSKAQSQPTKDLTLVYQEAAKSTILVVAIDAEGRALKQGSGFVVGIDGTIITNYHVISGASSAVVKFADGSIFEIEGFFAADAAEDIAVLKIRATGREFAALPLGDSDQVQVGERVVAIGSPLALEGSASDGIISAWRTARDISPRLPDGLRVLQTTAPISHGSSGGALLNMRGEAIGITSFGFTQGQNLNFAVPISYLRPLLGQHEVKPLSRLIALTVENERPNGSTRHRVPGQTGVEGAPGALHSAKTICILSGSPIFKTEISKKLIDWGKLTLVSSPADADLVLKVEQTGRLNLATGEGSQATALLTDQQTGEELWGKTKGGSWSMKGYSDVWVARTIASEFIKFYSSSEKKTQKK